MYGLAVEGLAPKYFARLNRKGNPRKAVYLTLAGMWVVLLIGLISELTGALTSLYGNLLCLSGFTGNSGMGRNHPVPEENESQTQAERI